MWNQKFYVPDCIASKYIKQKSDKIVRKSIIIIGENFNISTSQTEKQASKQKFIKPKNVAHVCCSDRHGTAWLKQRDHYWVDIKMPTYTHRGCIGMKGSVDMERFSQSKCSAYKDRAAQIFLGHRCVYKFWWSIQVEWGSCQVKEAVPFLVNQCLHYANFCKFPFIFPIADILYPLTIYALSLINYHLVATKFTKIDCRLGIFDESWIICIIQTNVLDYKIMELQTAIKELMRIILLLIRANSYLAFTTFEAPGPHWSAIRQVLLLSSFYWELNSAPGRIACLAEKRWGWNLPLAVWLHRACSCPLHSFHFMRVGPVELHKTRSSEGPSAWGLTLCYSCLEILNNFTREAVFFKWSCMVQQSIHQGLGALAQVCLTSTRLPERGSWLSDPRLLTPWTPPSFLPTSTWPLLCPWQGPGHKLSGDSPSLSWQPQGIWMATWQVSFLPTLIWYQAHPYTEAAISWGSLICCRLGQGSFWHGHRGQSTDGIKRNQQATYFVHGCQVAEWRSQAPLGVCTCPTRILFPRSMTLNNK